jgi:hypothetical protein
MNDGRFRNFLDGNSFVAKEVKHIGFTVIMNDLSDGQSCTSPDEYQAA